MNATKPGTLPRPEVPDSRDAPPLRWGILGAGWIAEKFASSLERHSSQRVVAMGSRSQDTAEAFAERHEGMRGCGSYRELVAAEDVDVVYVATPHPMHAECARLALEAGKHVLVEKPLGINAGQVEELRDLARSRGLFLMEALWTLFLPRYDVVRRVLEAGQLGKVEAVIADNGEWMPGEHRIWDPALAGGPMLDLGTYPVTLANWVLGDHEELSAFGTPHPSGVTGQVAAILRYRGGAQGVIHTGILGVSRTAATIVGSEGTLELPGPFYMPGDVILRAPDGEVLDAWREENVRHDALHFQAAAVARDIAAGRTESSVRPLAGTLSTLRTMDAIRQSCGDRFPMEA